MSGARSVMTVDECRVESVSNGFSLVHLLLLWKAKNIFEEIGWALSTQYSVSLHGAFSSLRSRFGDPALA